MQLDRFTQKSREAIQASISLAAERKNAQVAPIHLLAALLRADGRARAADPRPHRRAPSTPTSTPRWPRCRRSRTVAEPTTDPDVMAVLRAAEHEAREMPDEYITDRAPAALARRPQLLRRRGAARRRRHARRRSPR